MSVAAKSRTDKNNQDVEGDILVLYKELSISQVYPNIYLKWKAANESYPISITFSDFIDYWVRSESLSQNICTLQFGSKTLQAMHCVI